MRGSSTWAAADADASNQSRLRFCHTSLRRYLVLLVGFASISLHAFVWRHYLAIVFFTPPSTYKYRYHYAKSYAAANASQVATLREELTLPLPKWITQYVHWHANVRESGLNKSTPILLVNIGGHAVGGLADRLRSLPFLLWEAVRTDRIFLMQWSNPCAIEEFLLPPLGGVDWTVPTYLDISHGVWYNYDDHDNMQLTDNYSYHNYSVIQIRHNPWTFGTGMRLLAKALNVSTWSDPVFANIYKLLLTPSPPVQQSLDYTMQRLGLTSHQFDAVHLRARYPGASDAFQPKPSLFSRGVDADGFQWTLEAKKEILRLATRAISCVPKASNSNISLPIYFASDTNEAVKVVTQVEKNVVGMVTSYERLHLNRNDRIGLIRKTPPSAFYPAFVDLWILAQARCLAVGAGGYGIVASIIGETDCVVYYQKNSFAGGEAKYCPGVE